MITLQQIRKRLPLWAFILLAVLCLVLLGIACACATDHPGQKIDRAVNAIHMAPAVVEIWTFTFGTLLVFLALEVRRRRSDDTTSPALLQRFLF